MTRFSSCSVLIGLLALCLSMSSFAATITVTSTDDTVAAADGKVTFREAITSINAGNDLGDADIASQSPGAYGSGDTIRFSIPGAGVHVITTTSTMTPIFKTVLIDGYSQPGSSPNTNAFEAGINAVLLIEIVGLPGNAVLNINAAGTEVRGLAIHGGRNIVGASNVVIAGNFLGTNASGTTALGLVGSDYCIQVISSGSTISNNVIIGGPADADRNLIVSSGIGVQLPFLPPGPGTGYVIEGNYIGTDITGTIALARGDGMDSISNALVTRNLISGNPLGGMQLTDNSVVRGNLFGTKRDGTSPLPNGNYGAIQIQGGNSTIGGDGKGDPNVIANSTNYGIVIYNQSSQGSSNINTRNRISRNSIYANGRLGISLDYSPFVLPNDPGDGDSWAVDEVGNDGQNYPVLTSAVVVAGDANVSGTLNSVGSSLFTLEFFANASCDASGFGQGQTYVGTIDVSTDASGNASFGPLTFPVPTGQSVITSTATDAAGNTSEFSKCLVATGGTSPTTTSVVSSINPSSFGQTVTFTATVAGGTAPSGSVQFMDGAANLGSPVSLSGATAALTTATLGVGTHPITAIYSGDAGNSASSSSTLSQVVNDATPSVTTTSLVSSLNPSSFGQTVTFTATVAGGTSPTGTLQFMDGVANLGSPVSLSGTTAALTTATLSVGTHPITAVYSGDAGNSGSSSSTLNQIVNGVGPGATSTSVASSLNPSLFGQSVTFTATVIGTNPTGTVDFSDGTTLLGTEVLGAGSATFTTSTLTIGSHPIRAVYSGDATNTTSTSTTLMQTVAAAGPPGAAHPIPSLSSWMLLLLTGLLLGTAMLHLSRRPIR